MSDKIAEIKKRISEAGNDLAIATSRIEDIDNSIEEQYDITPEKAATKLKQLQKQEKTTKADYESKEAHLIKAAQMIGVV